MPPTVLNACFPPHLSPVSPTAVHAPHHVLPCMPPIMPRPAPHHVPPRMPPITSSILHAPPSLHLVLHVSHQRPAQHSFRSTQPHWHYALNQTLTTTPTHMQVPCHDEHAILDSLHSHPLVEFHRPDPLVVGSPPWDNYAPPEQLQAHCAAADDALARIQVLREEIKGIDQKLETLKQKYAGRSGAHTPQPLALNLYSQLPSHL